MNPFSLVRAQCRDVIRNLAVRGRHQMEDALMPVLRAAKRDGVIDGWHFKFRDSRLYIHIYRSPVNVPENHHEFYCIWPSVIADMRDSIDGV